MIRLNLINVRRNLPKGLKGSSFSLLTGVKAEHRVVFQYESGSNIERKFRVAQGWGSEIKCLNVNIQPQRHFFASEKPILS